MYIFLYEPYGFEINYDFIINNSSNFKYISDKLSKNLNKDDIITYITSYRTNIQKLCKNIINFIITIQTIKTGEIEILNKEDILKFKVNLNISYMEQLLKILNMKEDENKKILYNNLIRYIIEVKYILNIDKNIIIYSDNLDKEVNKIIIYIKNKSYNRFYYCRLIDFIYININNIFSNGKFNNVELSEEYKKYIIINVIMIL